MPRTKRETTVATTDEITIGESWATAKPPTTTSAAKSAPAIGALNVAAMPAAAPQPTITRSWLAGTFSACPSVEAMAELIWTIGPSRPTEPPEPIEMAEANAFTATTRARITPPRSATAAITSGTPWPLASRAKNQIRGPTSRPPIAGITRRHCHPRSWATRSGSPASASRPSSTRAEIPSAPWKKAPCTKRIIRRKTMAPSAPARPHAIATSTMNRCPLVRPRSSSLVDAMASAPVAGSRHPSNLRC